MQIYNKTRDITVKMDSYESRGCFECSAHKGTSSTKFEVWAIIFDTDKKVNTFKINDIALMKGTEVDEKREFKITDVSDLGDDLFGVTLEYNEKVEEKKCASNKGGCKCSSCKETKPLENKVKFCSEDRIEAITTIPVNEISDYEINIKSDGKKYTIASLNKDVEVKEVGYSRCADDDTFDFTEGVTLALERLLKRVKVDKETNKEPFVVNGKTYGFKGQPTKILIGKNPALVGEKVCVAYLSTNTVGVQTGILGIDEGKDILILKNGDIVSLDEEKVDILAACYAE